MRMNKKLVLSLTLRLEILFMQQDAASRRDGGALQEGIAMITPEATAARAGEQQGRWGVACVSTHSVGRAERPC